VIKLLPKGSKLIFIFILTVIVSGGILAYLSISHISNYRELLEKKISEEERILTKRFSSDFQEKLDELTLAVSNYLKRDNFTNEDSLHNIDSIKGIINYVVIDTNGLFIKPYFTNNATTTNDKISSKVFLERLRAAENNEFRLKDFNTSRFMYLKTLEEAGNKSDSAGVYNSMARLFVKMNLQQKAIDNYQIVLTKFDNTFNSSGFPYSYFSINKLLLIGDNSNFEQIQKLLLSFLNGLANSTIPLNDSSSDLLESIEKWMAKHQNRINNDRYKELMDLSRNSLQLVENYKIRIENIYIVSNNEATEDSPVIFSSIYPASGNNEELMLFFEDHPISVGIVIGLNPLFMSVHQNQEFNDLKFEYELELVEKTNNYLVNTNIVMRSEFSAYFEDSLVQISLKNEDIINENVLRKQITYGIGLFLFLGIMVLGLYLLIQDVNREKRMNKLRADFVSNVSHELKTPLTAINMFAEAMNMKNDNLDSKQKKYTKIIVKESEKLNRMINNILEFSRKENNKLSYKLERSNLTDIVNATLKEMSYFLEINKIDVHLNISNNIYAKVNAEGLKQALSNLISNAIKYSSSNKKMNVQLFKKENKIFIEVEDFGIGIPEEKLELIFEKFYRVNSDENENASGTGLGLTVTKAIIEEQHGKLLVESTFGKGSKFIIVLGTA
jgi:signal transduction histidine kinase